MPELSVAALIVGDPGPQELWTLRAVAAAGCRLSVVRARAGASTPRWQRAVSLLRRHGPLRALSRAAGALIEAREAARQRARLEELFDMEDLRVWWAGSRLQPIEVGALNAPETARELSRLAPDVIVRVSGGVLKPHVLAQARVAALNIHHGRAPRIRGMWSIPWAVIEGRADWIGATIHVMDEGIDTGPILWRGAPQLCPGDTVVDLQFRAHVEAADALGRLLRLYAEGGRPRPWPLPAGEPSVYRSSPGLGGWLSLLRLDRGRRARVLLERALEC